MLAAARPTAVNLAWGVAEALSELDRDVVNPQEARGRIAARARRIHGDEVARCRAMGAHGAALFEDGSHLMTQCNTGGLATGGYGTALGVVLALAERGGDPHVWVPETRPLLQGARLTAYELAEAGIRHTLVTDNATGAILREGGVGGHRRRRRPHRRERRHREQDRHLQPGRARAPPRRAVLRRRADLDDRPGDGLGRR